MQSVVAIDQPTSRIAPGQGKSEDGGVNTIQSGMLIGLGFLAATLLGLLVAPAFWRRAVRLTSRRIKEAIPLSEMEIDADRDRIRAEYAIKMHKLETLVEHVRFDAARQQIEVNRRDARVNMLEADLEKLTASYEEAQNARRVLEQTIADRLPKVEVRLTDAKKLLHAREREVGALTLTAERQVRALAEASSINAQQQSEIERLSSSLATRIGTSASDVDLALRSELEGLRVKTREQAQLLARMQSLAGRPAVVVPVEGAEASAADGSVARTADVELERQVRSLRASNDDQAAEIARLKAAIAVFESETETDGKVAIRESRVALRARLQSIEAQAAQQMETIAKLRSELAAANERQARQAAHFTGELRRLAPATGMPRRGIHSEAPARSSLAERVVQAQAAGNVSQPFATLPSDTSVGDRPPAPGANAATEPSEQLRVEIAGRSAQLASVTDIGRRGESAGKTVEAASIEPLASSNLEPKPAAAAAAPARRPRLLDRLAGLSRTP